MEKTSIVGGQEIAGAAAADGSRKTVFETNAHYWNQHGNDFLGAVVLPSFGGIGAGECRRLLGDIAGKQILEIGCGNGRSLKHLGEQGAKELWGLDISESQLQKAEALLAESQIKAKLICAPMEEDCGIPENYFDLVVSVYAVGWAHDLAGLFKRVYNYLKPGGIFAFSWSHPIHKCVAKDGENWVFKKCYYDESWYTLTLGGGELTLSDRMLSTFINALADAGFVIERMAEKPDLSSELPADDFEAKSRLMPQTVAFRARKPL